MSQLKYHNNGELVILFERSKQKRLQGSLELTIAKFELPKPVVQPKKKLSPADVRNQRENEKVNGIMPNVSTSLLTTLKLKRPIFNSIQVQRSIRVVAILLLIVSFVGLFYSVLPVVATAISQSQAKLPESTETLPVGTSTPVPTLVPTAAPIDWNDFYITIPRINIDSKIVPNVDPVSMDDYQTKLLDNGVAHAKGTYLPGQDGPVVLFAHSTDSVANIIRFNAKFFAARELVPGDEIVIQFNHKIYRYYVTSQSVINPRDLDHIRETDADLVLSTCYPPGTSWQRLIIFAKQVNP